MKQLFRGIKSLGILVTATGLINRFFDWTGVLPSNWLAWWLDAYKSLFHWLVDSTLGRLMEFLGYQILSWGKDVIVLYFVFGAAMVLTGEREGEVSFVDRLTMLAFWPIILLSPAIFKIMEPKDPIYAINFKGLHGGSERSLEERELYRSFLVDVLFVFGLAVIGIVLNTLEILS